MSHTTLLILYANYYENVIGPHNTIVRFKGLFFGGVECVDVILTLFFIPPSTILMCFFFSLQKKIWFHKKINMKNINLK